MSYGKLNIGIDRVKFSIKEVFMMGKGKAMESRTHMELGERGKLIDISTGEVIGISKFVCNISGNSMNNADDYRILLKLNENNENYTLDVNIPKLLYNTNERNASNKLHLSEVPMIIEKKLRESGYIVDMKQARLTSIEININSTDKKLYDCMKLIRKGLNNSDDKVFLVEHRNRLESVKSHKGSKGNKPYAEVKVYDKVKQLKDTGQLYENENLVRIEVSTRQKLAINTITGNNPTMEGLIENWDKLESWYLKRINEYIKVPTEGYIKSVENEMVEQLKEGHKTYDVLGYHALEGNLVDLEIFARAMKRYYKEVGKKSPYSIIRNTKARLEKVDKVQYDSLVGNIEALEKLWSEMGL